MCCIIFDWLFFHYFLQLLSVGLAWKSAAKSNENTVNQNYATLFLFWMPFNWQRFHVILFRAVYSGKFGRILLYFLTFLLRFGSMHSLLFYKKRLYRNKYSNFEELRKKLGKIVFIWKFKNWLNNVCVMQKSHCYL